MVEVLLSDAVDILKVMGNEQAAKWKKDRVVKEFDKQVLFEEWDAELFGAYKFNRRLKRLIRQLADQDSDEIEIVDAAEEKASEDTEDFKDGTDEDVDDDVTEEGEEGEDDESEIGTSVVDDDAEDDGLGDQEDDEGKVEGVTVGDNVISVGDWIEVNDPAYPVPYKGQLKEIQNDDYGIVVTMHGKEWEQAFEHMTLCDAPKRGVKKTTFNRQQCVMKVLKELKKPTAVGTVVKLSDKAFVDQGGKRKANAEQAQKYLEMILEVLVYFDKAAVKGKMISVS